MAMTITPQEALISADENVPRVVRKFLAITEVSQTTLAEHLKINQSDLAKRLHYDADRQRYDVLFKAREIRAMAAFFGVNEGTFFRPVVEAHEALLDSIKRAGGDPEYPRIYLP